MPSPQYGTTPGGYESRGIVTRPRRPTSGLAPPHTCRAVRAVGRRCGVVSLVSRTCRRSTYPSGVHDERRGLATNAPRRKQYPVKCRRVALRRSLPSASERRRQPPLTCAAVGGASASQSATRTACARNSYVGARARAGVATSPHVLRHR